MEKEEPKQETLTYTEAAKKEERIFNSTMMSKQETLEEAAQHYAENWEEITGLDWDNIDPIEASKIDFIAGAKWQAEKMYTYDELRQIAYNAYCKGQLDEPTEGKFNLWIQQFKKK